MFEPMLASLLSRIARTGPLTLAEYMTEASYRAGTGYYAAGDPLGQSGDFVTAPEISQMFGELLGAWVVAVWIDAGRPEPACLVELGPGRGTMMADMLRAMAGACDVRKVFRIHLVETNHDLRQCQAGRLAAFSPCWHDDVTTLPDAAWFIVANEFFDSLPIRQLVRTGDGWHETLVGARADGCGLAWALDGRPSPLAALLPGPVAADAGEGSVAEICPAAITLVSFVADRIAERGGAMIIVDYGDAREGLGCTVQAVSRHRRVDPLAAPGKSDLSSHVDFSALLRAADAAGACGVGPVEQGTFLLRLGIRQRAATLSSEATERQRAAIADALHRLVARSEMGRLFKAIAVTSRTGSVPAGFA